MTSSPADDRSPPKFELRQPVAVPDVVHASKSATIAGYEFGGRKSAGWMYYLAFVEGGQAWEASEDELVAWQGG